MPIFGGERVGLFHGVAVRYIETLPLFRGKHSGFFGKRTDMIERRFKFIWSRTWPDREQDFVAADGERQIGRVYRIAGVEERWK